MLWMSWLSCLFFVQGMHVGVLGADHTWFMTTLMICYILTPLIEKIWKRIQYKKTQWGILVGLLIVPFIMAYLLPNYIFFITYHVCFYAIAYYVGSNWERLGKSTNKSAVIYFIVMCLAFATRFIGRAMIDGISFEIYLCHYMFIVGPVSVMYITGNWIINSIIAVCIALLFAVILHKLSKGMRKILRIHGT